MFKSYKTDGSAYLPIDAPRLHGGKSDRFNRIARV